MTTNAVGVNLARWQPEQALPGGLANEYPLKLLARQAALGKNLDKSDCDSHDGADLSLKAKTARSRLGWQAVLRSLEESDRENRPKTNSAWTWLLVDHKNAVGAQSFPSAGQGCFEGV